MFLRRSEIPNGIAEVVQDLVGAFEDFEAGETEDSVAAHDELEVAAAIADELAEDAVVLPVDLDNQTPGFPE
ncbi:MAG: hypothetical protein WDO69_14715 [Pseudomonadota bacterium]